MTPLGHPLGVRLVAVALTVCLAMAGCFTAEPLPDETTGGSSEPDPGETTPDEPTAPAATPPGDDPIEVRHDYSADAESVTFEVPEGFYDVRIGWYAPPSVMGCVSADARVVVSDPAGEVYADLAPSAVQTPCDGNGNGKQSKELLLGGTWTADFTGTGVAVAVITLTPL